MTNPNTPERNREQDAEKRKTRIDDPAGERDRERQRQQEQQDPGQRQRGDDPQDKRQQR